MRLNRAHSTSYPTGGRGCKAPSPLHYGVLSSDDQILSCGNYIISITFCQGVSRAFGIAGQTSMLSDLNGKTDPFGICKKPFARRYCFTKHKNRLISGFGYQPILIFRKDLNNYKLFMYSSISTTVSECLDFSAAKHMRWLPTETPISEIELEGLSRAI